MKKVLLIIFLVNLQNIALSSIKDNIIDSLNNTNNLSFNFEQNINGKIELGNCTIQYPKKMFCEYDKKNKVMVSNGKSLVIKSNLSYYRYALNKTPLNFILDKNFLLKKISELNEEIINNSLIKFTIKENNQLIDIFFDIKNYELVGWQTKDIYQNSAFTLLSSISKNQNIEKKLFRLPVQN